MFQPSPAPVTGHVLAPPPPMVDLRLPVERLPFVGHLPDGQKSFWIMAPLAPGEGEGLRARTYAAWFLVYAELNGPEAARRLLGTIERDMPSRLPAVDRIFLKEVCSRF